MPARAVAAPYGVEGGGLRPELCPGAVGEADQGLGRGELGRHRHDPYACLPAKFDPPDLGGNRCHGQAPGARLYLVVEHAPGLAQDALFVAHEG